MTTPARATLQVSAYTRRAPVDPYAEIKARTTAQLKREAERREVAALKQLDRDMAAALLESLAMEGIRI